MKDWERICRRLLVLDSYGINSEFWINHADDERFLEDDWLVEWFGEPLESYVQEELDVLDLRLSEERSRPKPGCCSDCGLNLDLEQWQLDWVVEHGNPVPRPPCPANENKQHRITFDNFGAVAQ